MSDPQMSFILQISTPSFEKSAEYTLKSEYACMSPLKVHLQLMPAPTVSPRQPPVCFMCLWVAFSVDFI